MILLSKSISKFTDISFMNKIFNNLYHLYIYIYITYSTKLFEKIKIIQYISIYKYIILIIHAT